MSDASLKQASSPDSPPPPRELEELRQLLFEPEQTQLVQLQERLDNPALHAKDVGRVLPDAILLRAKQDRRLAQSLSPIIEESLKHSVTKSPRMIVEAIAPIMGPSIRQAISLALRSMVQSLNQALEHSLSWQGVQWRIEAYRTGKPFGEVVLLHTLRFRVEQVFLIHRDTGLLVQHVSAESIAQTDEAVVSGMLTAIQDFVRDSFGSGQGEGLDLLHIGELTVLIEQGSQAILAGVVRGTPPAELRTLFQEVLEGIHAEYGEALLQFDGESASLEMTRPLLEECLQAQYQKPPARPSPILWIIGLVLVAVLAGWGLFNYQQAQRWTDFLTFLNTQPGVVVTAVEERDGKRIISGLKDPLAPDPMEWIRQAGLDPNDVGFDWEPYVALTSPFLEQRIRAALHPPPSVSFTIDEGRLILAGSAPHTWIQQVQSGGAWLPGITGIDSTRLIDTDFKQIETLKTQLEEVHLLFPKGQSRLTNDSRRQLRQVTSLLQALDQAARAAGRELTVEVQGHATPIGSVARNNHLSLQRAKSVATALEQQPFQRIRFIPVGKGAGHPLVTGGMGTAQARNRRVSFLVKVDER